MIEARLHLPRRDFTLDVDLRLPGSGVTVLFGASGCGKTTVLRALAGLERATGRVAFGSEVWQDDTRGVFLPTHRRPLGYVIQEAALFPHLDVRRNLDYGRRRSADAGRIALDRDLLDGHCGHLSAARLPAMRAAQRARDASMALALQASGGRPAVLVAGNGHVRTDQGVALLLRALPGRPQVLCVGFGEPGWSAAGAPYTHLWITPPVRRGDPCAGFRMPPPRPA